MSKISPAAHVDKVTDLPSAVLPDSYTSRPNCAEQFFYQVWTVEAGPELTTA